jgi:hypothetical protein
MEVVLVEGLPRVEIVVRMDKRLVYDPEAVLLRFAFAAAPGNVRVSIPGGAFAIEREQLPGANRNYLSARSWVELPGDTEGPEGNLVLVTLDVPMIQVGPLGSDPIVTGWRARAEPSGTIWSYVMNNYWETNYRAGQEGPFEARYVLATDANPEVAAWPATRPLVVVR